MGTTSVCRNMQNRDETEILMDKPSQQRAEMKSEEAISKTVIQESSHSLHHIQYTLIEQIGNELYLKLLASRSLMTEILSQNMLLSEAFSQIIQQDQFPLAMPSQKQEVTEKFNYFYQPKLHENVKEVLSRSQKFEPTLEQLYFDCSYSELYFRLANGYYQGQWSHGIRCGFGKFISDDESYYEGYWANDVKHGPGRYINMDGDSFQGHWFADQQVGEGVYTHYHGAVFNIPDLAIQQAEKLMSAGVYFFTKHKQPNIENKEKGFKYYGKIIDNRRVGFGIYIWDNGCHYEGQFSNDCINGFGKMTLPDGKTYRGMWVDAKWHGFGELTYPDGKIYIGNFEDDKQTGYGFIKWPDGRQYRGQLLAGKMEGIGRYIDKKGKILEGKFKDGKRLRGNDSQSYIISSVNQTPLVLKSPRKNEDQDI